MASAKVTRAHIEVQVSAAPIQLAPTAGHEKLGQATGREALAEPAASRRLTGTGQSSRHLLDPGIVGDDHHRTYGVLDRAYQIEQISPRRLVQARHEPHLGPAAQPGTHAVPRLPRPQRR